MTCAVSMVDGLLMCLSIDNVLPLNFVFCFLNGMNEHLAMKLWCILSAFSSTASLHVFRKKKEKKKERKTTKTAPFPGRRRQRAMPD